MDLKNKVMVFTINSRQGIEKNYDGSNDYKHVITFENDSKREEFVDEYLCKKGSTSKQEWDTIEASFGVSRGDAKTFTFSTNLKQQGTFADGSKRFTTMETLTMRDTAMTMDREGKKYFWAINCIRRTSDVAFFNAVLDVAFTYYVHPDMFDDNALNFVSKAHVDRFKRDSNGNITQEIDWIAVLRNNLKFQPTIQKKIKITSQSNHKDLHWYIINVLNGLANKQRSDWWKKVLGTTGSGWTGKNVDTKWNGVVAPFTTYLIPVHRTKKIFCEGGEIDTETIINKIFEDNTGYITNAVITKELCLNEKGQTKLTTLNSNNKVIANTGNAINYLSWVPSSTLNNKWKTTKKASIFILHSLDNIDFERMEIEPITLDKTIDPINYHPNANVIKLETWNGEAKEYALHRIIPKDNDWKIVKCLRDPTPLNDPAIAYIKQNPDYQESEILNDSYINFDAGKEVPLSESKFTQYMRDNKNTFETNKTFTRIQSVADIIQKGAIGYAAGREGYLRNINQQLDDGMMHTTPLKGRMYKGGGVLIGATPSIINLIKEEMMRDGQIKDKKSQIPSYKVGTGLYAPLIMENEIADANNLQVNQYTLPEFLKKQMNDQAKIFGYDVGINMKLKDIIHSRKGFVYVEANNVFNSINDTKYKLSAPIKQIFGTMFRKGVWIWIYRDKASWKGIMDFDKDNKEV